MARPGVIDRLPAEVREKIGRLRAAGSTRDEIRALLERDHGLRIARSTMGDHLRRLDQLHEQIRRTRGIAEAMVERFGDAPEHRTGRLAIELAQGVMMQLLAGEDGEPVSLTPQEAAFVAKAIADLARAQRLDAERELKLRQEFARQAADQAETVARGEGLTDAALARIRAVILGLVESEPAPRRRSRGKGRPAKAGRSRSPAVAAPGRAGTGARA